MMNEFIEQDINYCIKHNFHLEAEGKKNTYQHGRKLLVEFRSYVYELEENEKQ